MNRFANAALTLAFAVALPAFSAPRLATDGSGARSPTYPTGSRAAYRLSDHTSVTPDGGAVSAPTYATDGRAIFTLTNTSGADDSYTLNCGVTGAVTGCSAAPTWTAVGPYESVTIVVTFSTAAAGQGVVWLSATSDNVIYPEPWCPPNGGECLQDSPYSDGDAGDYHVTVVGGGGGAVVSVTPDVSDDRLAISSSGSYPFVVHNLSSTAQSVTFTCIGTLNVSCGSYQTSRSIPPNTDVTQMVGVTASSQPGTGTITLRATVGATSDYGLRSFTVFRPEQASMWLSSEAVHERGRCVATTILGDAAMQCGDLLVAHALPAYRSHGRARALTLLYNSQNAQPVPMAQVDYTTFTGEALPSSVRVTVRNQSLSGAIMADVTYSTAGWSNSTTQTHRFSVPLSVAGLAMYPGAWTTSIELSVPGANPSGFSRITSLVYQHEQASPIGAGWTIAGVERILDQGSAGAVVVYADGSSTLYAKAGTAYVAPPGEYSTLRRTVSAWERTTEDGLVTVVYDTSGYMATVSDRHGNQASYVWGSNPALNGYRLESITDPAGLATTFGYAGGRLSWIKQPATDTVHVSRNGAWVTGITDPDSLVTSFDYAPGTNLMRSYTGRGLGAVNLSYHASTGRLTQAALPYSGLADIIRFRSPEEEGLTAAGFAERAQVAIVRQRNIAAGPDSAWFRVDRFGAPTVAVNPVGAVTEVTRDSLSQPTYVVTPLGHRLWQEWENGLLQRVLEQSATSEVARDITRYEYGDPNWPRLLTKIVRPEGDSVRFVYAATTGDRTQSIDGAGNITTFRYDGLGRLTSVREPLDTLADSLIYSGPNGNLGEVRTPATTNPTIYTYDPNNSDVFQVQAPNGAVTQYTLDAMKRPRLVRQIGSGSPTRDVTYTYDDALRTRRMIDPLNHETTWTYDLRGRLATRTSGGRTETYAYEDGVNLTKVITRRGDWLLMDYNGAGWLTTRYVQPTINDPGDNVTYHYNAAGQPDSIVSTYSRIYRLYTERGELAYETQSIRSWNMRNGAYWWQPVSRAHRYDRDGRRRASFLTPQVGTAQKCASGSPFCIPLVFVYQDSMMYQYNSRGLVGNIVNTLWRSEAQAQNTTWTFDWDDNGRLRTLTVPLPSGSANVGYTFDGADRPRTYSLVAALGGARNQTMTYVSASGDVDHVTGGAGGDRYYTYDGFGQLKTDGSIPQGWDYNQFTYDAAGNRATDRGFTYYYDARGRLDYRQSASVGTERYYYDDAGNLTRQDTDNGAVCRGPWGAPQNNTRVLEYTADNRVYHSVRWVYNQNACRREDRYYWYDGLGRLILIRSNDQFSSDWGTTRLWWMDGELAVRLRNAGSTSDADYIVPQLYRDFGGLLQAFGEWYYPGLGTDQTLASFNFSDAGAGYAAPNRPHRHLFVRDWRGSVIKVAEHDGTATVSPHIGWQEYNAFGSADGAVAQAGPGYNGAPSVDGFQYLRNRWYDPTTGRFTQEDPIGFGGGINLYAYAGSNPVMYTDPFGLCKQAPGSGDTPCDLIKLVFAEASSENRAGMQAVGSVVRNRVDDTTHEFRHVGGYQNVIHQSGQFNGVGNEQWRLAGAQMTSKNHDVLTGANATAYSQAVSVATGIFNRTLPDNTGGSLFFATPGNFGGAVNRCVSENKCEKVDVQGDLGQHEFVRYRQN